MSDRDGDYITVDKLMLKEAILDYGHSRFISGLSTGFVCGLLFGTVMCIVLNDKKDLKSIIRV